MWGIAKNVFNLKGWVVVGFFVSCYGVKHFAAKIKFGVGFGESTNSVDKMVGIGFYGVGISIYYLPNSIN
ncbi:MAG: hypothetical protein COZ75_07555 [Flavobacteriaceae bacterium CG_4_8_14_3_um_filter_34_10]|nr:MAG: hypothetical protein COZ75_07555 [Flavobacteriaceae bacterium CG_4_8_14_3_um_filter_34_10]